MTNWDHQKLYDLKGQIVSSGVKAITGMDMPVFAKRRFQHGAASDKAFNKHFPVKDIAYRKEFLSNYEF
jgi:asparagine synthase (glutamine-hydrolysing)